MSDFEYTPSQRLAVKERDKNIIISAAAGSGKTRVLVDRVIDLLASTDVNIDQMIIVTFTTKASIEMKDRIREELEKKISSDPTNYKLADQLKLLKHAHIQTLHSFATDMLREYFYYLDGLSPSFKVIPETANVLMQQEALDELFDEEYKEGRASFENFIHNFSTSKNDRGAKKIILETYYKTTSQIDPIGWLDEKTSANFDFSYLRENIKDQIYLILNDIEKNRNIVLDNALRVEYVDLIESDYSNVSASLRLIDDDWDSFIDYLKNIKFATMVRARKDEKDIQPVIKNNRDNYKKEVEKLAKLLLNTKTDIILEFNKKEAEVLAELNDLTKKFINIYQAKKREKSYLDFTDMERDFIKLLANDEARSAIRERFAYIFFDEYQDSNEIQNYIIEEIKRDDNLFFVGDVKQSIYGFRRAEPRLFLEKLETYVDEDNDKAIRIDLNENFRTDKDILAFDNYIFDRLMTKESSGIDYKNGGHRLNATKDFELAGPKTEVHILDGEVDEAEHLVSVINDLVAKGTAYRDIAILLRSGNKSYIYEEAFKNADIPFFNDISKVSFGAVEVTFFINILKLIANPKDDLSLLAVLQSEIFGFSEDDLATIRLAAPSVKFYEAFDSFDQKGPLLDKINDFKTSLFDYSYQLSLMDLYEFGNYIFEKSGYYDFLTARDRAADRIGNVEAFIDLMADYEADNDNGLYGFLSFIENLSLHQSDRINTTRDLAEAEDLVRIMTIHKSKGLEFPVLILADSAKRFNNQHLREAISFDDEIGIGINVADYKNKIKLSSIKRDLINQKITNENKREEMRVLYVALTRAINKLIVVGDMKVDKIDKFYNREDYLNMNSHMEWIIAALSTDKIAADIFGKPALTDAFGDAAVIKVIDDLDLSKVNAKRDINDILNPTLIDKALYKDFDRLFNQPYEFERDTKESVKKSVTEIAKNFNPEEDGYEIPVYETYERITDFRKPSFITEVKEYKAVDRGTIIHKVFEALSYQAYDDKKLNRALDRLVIENKIKRDELKVVENKKIIAYYNNPLIRDFYKNAVNIRKEESFLMKYEDIYVNGQIDLIFELKDEIILLDFKTDAIKREGFYDDQLKIYKRAIEESIGSSLKKPVTKAIIYWYNFGEIEEIK